MLLLLSVTQGLNQLLDFNSIGGVDDAIHQMAGVAGLEFQVLDSVVLVHKNSSLRLRPQGGCGTIFLQA
ncbi:hypothetical protein HMPREF0239_02083 [Clostridium sp. ATCC BAA-442]|nr:hypothetical protein HMPREF0239_02083 [Clostridium sp. ATCC BAA-442]